MIEQSDDKRSALNKQLKRALSSNIASICASTMLFPLEVIKTRM